MQPTTQPLAIALWHQRIGRLPAALILAIGGSIILALSAKVQVPFYPVPMTLQTFAVMTIAAAYGWRLAVATVGLYLLEGFVGLPVFANTPPLIAGPAYFMGTTAGFLIGFLPAAFIVGYAAEDLGWDRSIPKLFAAMVAADAVVFALGFIWLAWFAQLSSGATGLGVERAWINGVFNFMLADLLKIALAAMVIPASWTLVERKP
jgi:biotin transport system substrate-specific component